MCVWGRQRGSGGKNWEERKEGKVWLECNKIKERKEGRERGGVKEEIVAIH